MTHIIQEGRLSKEGFILICMGSPALTFLLLFRLRVVARLPVIMPPMACNSGSPSPFLLLLGCSPPLPSQCVLQEGKRLNKDTHYSKAETFHLGSTYMEDLWAKVGHLTSASKCERVLAARENRLPMSSSSLLIFSFPTFSSPPLPSSADRLTCSLAALR